MRAAMLLAAYYVSRGPSDTGVLRAAGTVLPVLRETDASGVKRTSVRLLRCCLLRVAWCF